MGRIKLHQRQGRNKLVDSSKMWLKLLIFAILKENEGKIHTVFGAIFSNL